MKGVAWVVACALPVIALEKLSSRYLYMMSVGYALALCGLMCWTRRLLREPRGRRLAAVSAGVGLVAVLAANWVDIQREIGDYRVLAEPFRACFETLSDAARALATGETLVVADVSSRDAVARLTRNLAERGNITKLIPYREDAVGGLIALDDLINAARATQRGAIALPVSPTHPGRKRVLAWDGLQTWDLPPASLASLPPDRLSAARLGSGS
jgi:hypothetical protein